MGYQALLFCPDDKTARTVTQVLSELEFTVEACIEPFAAVKKLMGQHFDAVVVDCDNEQNATLLFKSARNSTSNQTSLAVAVVEGQAGVAKAFRIGANLVLTKPINIEQAKGTLRVARGLLRKSDPTKPGTATGTFAVPTAPASGSAAAPAPAAAKPAAPRSAAAPRPTAPAAAKPAPPGATASFKAPQAPTPKPAAPSAWPTAAAKSTPIVQDAPKAPAVAEKPVAPAAPPAPPALYNATLATPAPQKPVAPPPVAEIATPSIMSSAVAGGAASAPAPAREPQVPRAPQKSPESVAEALFEKPVEAAPASESPAYVGAAPSFTFGGASAEGESSSGSKKALIGIAAVVLVAIGGYVGWSHFKGGSSTAPQSVATSVPAAPAATQKPASAQPSSAIAESSKVSPASQPDITIGTSPNAASDEHDAPTSGANSKPSASAAKSANVSSASAKPAVTEKAPAEKAAEEDEPPTSAMVVKGGKVPSLQAKSALAPDTPAPSLIGMGAPVDTALPNLGTSNSEFKPTLQALSVSQGVSQGLLIKKVAPSYPSNALRMHIEGMVELLATISKTGDITKVKVVSGDPQLIKAATDAVKQWKYKPYLLNGEPVEIQTQVAINFKMPH